VAAKICVLQAQNVGSALNLEQEKRNFTVYAQRFETQEREISRLFEADQARGSISSCSESENSRGTPRRSAVSAFAGGERLLSWEAEAAAQNAVLGQFAEETDRAVTDPQDRASRFGSEWRVGI
jgi:hypothetical protein